MSIIALIIRTYYSLFSDFRLLYYTITGKTCMLMFDLGYNN